jgi:hypothetical protein
MDLLVGRAQLGGSALIFRHQHQTRLSRVARRYTVPYKETVYATRFQVVRLRYRGRRLPKREWCSRPPVVGDLRVEQLYDEELFRHVRIARLVSLVRIVGPEQFPTLYDPVLIAMSPQAFKLAGFERVEGVDYAQSWLITATD